MIAQVIDGRFEIVAQLGEGATSVVYEAIQLDLQRRVAIKLLRTDKSNAERNVERFRREAIATAALRHPNITQVFGFGAVDDQPYLAMELLQGRSLASLLSEKKHLSAKSAVPLFIQIVDGLAHAHEKGILHRDLKPSNIMLVDEDTLVKIVDFGLSKFLPDSGKDMQKLTQTDSVLGTILYMSPEQCMGKELDQRSDLYSLGCMFYEMLAGHPPFAAQTAFATINQHLNEPAPLDDALRTPLGKVILSCLEKDPTLRPDSAQDLLEAIRNPEKFTAKRDAHSAKRTETDRFKLLKAFVFPVLVAMATLGIWIAYERTHRVPKLDPQEAHADLVHAMEDAKKVQAQNRDKPAPDQPNHDQMKLIQDNLRKALEEYTADSPGAVKERIDAWETLLLVDSVLEDWPNKLADAKSEDILLQTVAKSSTRPIWFNNRRVNVVQATVDAYMKLGDEDAMRAELVRFFGEIRKEGNQQLHDHAVAKLELYTKTAESEHPGQLTNELARQTPSAP